MPDPVEQGHLRLETLPPISDPYLDASVLLAHIKVEQILTGRGRTRAEITTALFEGAEQGRYKIITSTLTIAEVRRLRESGKELSPDELPAINALFKRFMEHEWIILVEVSRAVAEKAQELGAVYGMNPPDAIHLASAILTPGCSVLMVWDKSFSGKFQAGPVEGVHVLEPYFEGLAPLPSGGSSG